MPVSYMFAIDVTYGSMKSGLVSAACQAIRETLNVFAASAGQPNGQDKSEARIGIMTFGGGIQFYNLTASLGQPQMMVMTDLKDPFVPLKTGLFVSVQESREIIETLLTLLPNMFEHTRSTESFMGAAIDASIQAMVRCGSSVS